MRTCGNIDARMLVGKLPGELLSERLLSSVYGASIRGWVQTLLKGNRIPVYANETDAQ